VHYCQTEATILAFPAVAHYPPIAQAGENQSVDILGLKRWGLWGWQDPRRRQKLS
jgi:hypothetical protein